METLGTTQQGQVTVPILQQALHIGAHAHLPPTWEIAALGIGNLVWVATFLLLMGNM